MAFQSSTAIVLALIVTAFAGNFPVKKTAFLSAGVNPDQERLSALNEFAPADAGSSSGDDHAEAQQASIQQHAGVSPASIPATKTDAGEDADDGDDEEIPGFPAPEAKDSKDRAADAKQHLSPIRNATDPAAHRIEPNDDADGVPAPEAKDSKDRAADAKQGTHRRRIVLSRIRTATDPAAHNIEPNDDADGDGDGEDSLLQLSGRDDSAIAEAQTPQDTQSQTDPAILNDDSDGDGNPFEDGPPVGVLPDGHIGTPTEGPTAAPATNPVTTAAP